MANDLNILLPANKLEFLIANKANIIISNGFIFFAKNMSGLSEKTRIT